MGTTYQNFTVCGADREKVVVVLRDLRTPAFITPLQGIFTVVFSERGDAWESPEEASPLAIALSERLGCPVLVSAVFDDDVLCLSLHSGSGLVFEYDSSKRNTRGLNSLWEATGRHGSRLLLWTILKLPHLFPFFIETLRHICVLKILKMPKSSYALGYTNIKRHAEVPMGLKSEDLLEI